MKSLIAHNYKVDSIYFTVLRIYSLIIRYLETWKVSLFSFLHMRRNIYKIKTFSTIFSYSTIYPKSIKLVERHFKNVLSQTSITLYKC